eukprot:1618499-Rhodomonas_salina.3
MAILTVAVVVPGGARRLTQLPLSQSGYYDDHESCYSDREDKAPPLEGSPRPRHRGTHSPESKPEGEDQRPRRGRWRRRKITPPKLVTTRVAEEHDNSPEVEYRVQSYSPSRRRRKES